jgi:transcriptional antiterminator
MSENVTIHDKKESVQSILLVKNDSFPKTDDILRFQQPNNQHFSSKNNKKHTKKQSKRPKYRVINKYVKSKKKYWRERNRRKKVWELSGKLTYTQIAEKLGISEKTVQRDMKKISPYYIRLSSKYL